MSKRVTFFTALAILGGVLASEVSPVAASAIQVTNSGTTQQSVQQNNNSSTGVKGNGNIKPYTVVTTSKEKFEGQVVPYDAKKKTDGVVNLHYSNKMSGFIDGDKSYITVKLPEQMKYMANNPNFKPYISGTVKVSDWLGLHTRTKNYNFDGSDVDVYSDRIIFKNPRSLWVLTGKIQADIKIDYGKFLNYHSDIQAPNSNSGYKFVSDLDIDSAPWDIFKKPIFANSHNSFTTPETKLVINKNK